MILKIYFIIAQPFHLVRNSPNALVVFDPLSCTAAKILNVKTTVGRKKKKRLKVQKGQKSLKSLYFVKTLQEQGEDNKCTQISVEASIGT